MKLFICGKNGRMVLAIRKLAQADKKITLAAAPEQSITIIDFTAPDALEVNLAIAREYGSPYVVGTTGLSKEHQEALKEASHEIPVLWAPNMSLGANVLMELTRIASETLSDFKINIHDIHHQHKKDAPSGTALALAKAAVRPSEITSERMGEIAGIHEVLFTGPSETLSLKHEASDRGVFAEGALRAAYFLSKQKPGLYSMQDVLGFHK